MRKYIGTYRGVYFAHSTDQAIRERAASGGVVTALLAHLLRSREIDGALVLRTVVEDGRVHTRFEIATSADDLRRAQGSKYIAVYFRRDALPLLKSFPGRLAVVALPCDATALKRFRESDPDLDRKIRLVIALVCGHNSERELTDHVTETLGKGHGDLVDYKYREGHWRGHLAASYADGSREIRPFRYFSDFRNLYMFAQQKCHHCFDHFGYHCDISAGDVWSLYLRGDPVKHSGIITRSEAGEHAMHVAHAAGAIWLDPREVKEILDGQSRTMPFHYNVSARHRVGKIFGMRIKDKVRERVRWNDMAVAAMALFFQKFSNTTVGRRLVFLLPRPVLRALLMLMKGLEIV